MLVPVPVAAPDTPPEMVQLKVVLPTFEEILIAVVAPLQIVCVNGVTVATGIGSTVTTTLMGVPAQPAAVGVTL